MKIAFLGLGKAGERNLSILNRYNNYKYEISHFKHPISWDDVDKENPDVAFICNPTNVHIETALECAKRDMQLFIEKPIDCRLDNLKQLLEVINSKKLTAYVAYPYRHHPKIQYIKKVKFSPDAIVTIICNTNIEKWGSEYSWKEDTGGGVLFELSHEIDYAAYLFGKIKKIDGTLRRSGKLNIDDVASLKAYHETGVVSHIFLNLSATKEVRQLLINNETRSLKIGLKDKKDMYARQIKYFLENINNPRLTNNINEASELFRKIIEFKNKAV